MMRGALTRATTRLSELRRMLYVAPCMKDLSCTRQFMLAHMDT